MSDAVTPIGELRRMTASELRVELKRLRVEAAGLRLSLVMQSGKDSAAYKRARKRIAQICTVLGALPVSAQATNAAPVPVKKSLKRASQSSAQSVQRSRSTQAKAA